MPTRTDVINEALDYLGEPHSTGVNDQSVWVRRLSNVFERESRLLLEDHAWNFASNVVALSLSTPAWDGWTYRFSKPPKCWRILFVDNNTDMNGSRGIDYEVRKNFILTEHETTYLKYIDGDYLEPDAWPYVVASALAGRLANSIKQATDMSANKQMSLERKAVRLMSKAKTWDAQEMPRWSKPPTNWQVGRYSNGFGRYGRGD